jgi:hypothetical protein
MTDDNWTVGSEPGMVGAFTRHQAEGAIPNGTRIVKARGESGDATPLGVGGVVLGSLAGGHLGERAPDGTLVEYGYFVEFDNRPGFAVGVIDWKIARAS